MHVSLVDTIIKFKLNITKYVNIFWKMVQDVTHEINGFPFVILTNA